MTSQKSARCCHCGAPAAERLLIRLLDGRYACARPCRDKEGNR